MESKGSLGDLDKHIMECKAIRKPKSSYLTKKPALNTPKIEKIDGKIFEKLNLGQSTKIEPIESESHDLENPLMGGQMTESKIKSDATDFHQ